MKLLKKCAKKTILGMACGGLAGIAAAIFLITLEWATLTREMHPQIIWGLPVAGFLVGWIYHHFGKNVAAGHHLIIDEIHDPKKVVPVRMAPFILLGTVVTHLFGGSAGREGTAVQMGASLSDQLSRWFRLENVERKILLMAGAGAGFGAAIGTPWAGFIFGMEVIQIGRINALAWWECLIASFVAFYTSILLRAPHSVYPAISIPEFDLKIIFWIAIAGLVFGFAARVFVWSTHLVENVGQRFVTYPPLRPLLGGLLIIVLFAAEGSYQYAGLGIPVIQKGLTDAGTFREPILKSAFTSLTVGMGFKGGEFIPLVFIGTTLGNALSAILPVTLSLLAAVGFAAVFGAAANTPWACTLMAMEIFGYQIGLYAFVGCFVAYFVSSERGIYKTQKSHRRKFSFLKN